MKKHTFWLAILFAAIVQSCSMNSESMYYKDESSSLESNITIDQSLVGMLNGFKDDPKVTEKLKDIHGLGASYKSLFDLQKENKGKITLNQDSIKILKKVFLKLNKDGEDWNGLSFKYDKLFPAEIAQAAKTAKTGNAPKIPMETFGKWNGKTLTIDTEKLNIQKMVNTISEAENNPQTKADSIEVLGKNISNELKNMIQMFSFSSKNTLKFQNKIKSITGKHDYVKQIDDKTIQIEFNSKNEMDGNALKNSDPKIIVFTE